MKVSELTGVQLDVWVARAKGEAPGAAYSSDWSHGGPIIERERIAITPNLHRSGWWTAGYALDDMGEFEGPSEIGPTPLIAAMRAYVASKFGEEVEAP